MGESQGGALIKAPGHLQTSNRCLAGFDLSSVHTLELAEGEDEAGEALRQQLSRCPQLRALRLYQASFQQEALQAIVALPSCNTCACMLGQMAAAWRRWRAAAGS
jgi:hypothetical protein